MNTVLALDLSSWRGGVALLETGDDGEPRVVAELEVEVSDSHMCRLYSWIDFLLHQSGWNRERIDGYVATHGPGAFTGIRVALGTLRGLGLATGKPVVGVTTLEALAEAHGPAEADRIPLLPAGRGEVYGARYDATGSPPLQISAPRLAAPAVLLEDVAEAVVLTAPGAGAPIERAGLRTVALPRGVAAAAGRIAMRRELPGQGQTLAPLYLRVPDVGRRDRSA